ncbi:MAG: biotin/lipoyl-binding protein, partial [Arcobacteraceae bacterium]|nr:biotin/lipoyl-binding protein [Arcobacteraceae bacterium]
MKKIILIVLIAGLIFAGFKLIQSKKEEQSKQPTAFVAQETPKLQEETKKEDNFEYFQAKSEAIFNPKIATKISGYIENIKVKENQVVQKGEVLVQIETNEYQNNLKQSQYLIQSSKKSIESLKLSLESLKLDSDLAKTQYETNQKLYQIGGIAKEKLEFSYITWKQKESKYQSTLESIKAKEYELQSITASLASKESLVSYY